MPRATRRTSPDAAHYAAVLDGFTHRMSLAAAEDAYGLQHGTLRGAIERGELRYYKTSANRFRVSPQFVAEYIERFCTFQNDPIPS